jgi:hypothetical protein
MSDVSQRWFTVAATIVATPTNLVTTHLILQRSLYGATRLSLVTNVDGEEFVHPYEDITREQVDKLKKQIRRDAEDAAQKVERIFEMGIPRPA